MIKTTEQIEEIENKITDLKEELEMTLWSLSGTLQKACDDPYMYAMKLRTGDVIEFTSAAILSGGIWIHLDGVEKNENQPFLADRGIDVRISDIVWVMDAPHGS